MDFGAAIQFIFQDEDWIKKILIMTLIMLIPVVGQLVLIGWALEVARGVKRGDPSPLPELNFGDQLRQGFMLFLGGLIYAAPLIVLSCFYALPGVMASADMDAETIGLISTVIYGCVGCISLIYGIAMWFVVNAAYIRYMDSGEFSAFTGFGENIAMARENIGVFGQLLLFSILVGLIGGFVASLLSACLVGLAVYPMMTAAQFHLLGQAANKLGGMTSAPAV